MMSGREKRPGTRWRQALGLAGAAMLLQGCAYYVFNLGDFKNNPMDQAIATGNQDDHMKETRERLLKRYPIGRPVASVSDYLQSVGAKCRGGQNASAPVTCRYSKYADIVLRTPLGDIREIRHTYKFHIDLFHQRRLLRDVHVCRQTTVTWFRGTKSGSKESEEHPLKCLKGQNTKGE